MVFPLAAFYEDNAYIHGTPKESVLWDPLINHEIWYQIFNFRYHNVDDATLRPSENKLVAEWRLLFESNLLLAKFSENISFNLNVSDIVTSNGRSFENYIQCSNACPPGSLEGYTYKNKKCCCVCEKYLFNHYAKNGK